MKYLCFFSADPFIRKVTSGGRIFGGMAAQFAALLYYFCRKDTDKGFLGVSMTLKTWVHNPLLLGTRNDPMHGSRVTETAGCHV